MRSTTYLNRVLAQYGRMCAEDLAFARMRLEALPSNALVSTGYFFPADRWIAMSDGERRALGADFARRFLKGEFPGLQHTAGSNCHQWFRE